MGLLIDFNRLNTEESQGVDLMSNPLGTLQPNRPLYSHYTNLSPLNAFK